ncbi:hypothetical protein IFM89_013436 [Coptis chinensis]|uniref:Uncharacterized protein n=1 Tax=Coptis chinensis TaxID=261450 RepID=A0A835GWB1_9MAGN|nr:hypothetical protein IFM89_013436 [Coptis chinensis]
MSERLSFNGSSGVVYSSDNILAVAVSTSIGVWLTLPLGEGADAALLGVGEKTVTDGSNATYCIYKSDIATGYGVGSFLFLLSSQSLLMGITKCMCFGRPLAPGGNRAYSIIYFISSWLTFLIAEACLVGGAAKNAYHTKYRKMVYADFSCESLRKGCDSTVKRTNRVGNLTVHLHTKNVNLLPMLDLLIHLNSDDCANGVQHSLKYSRVSYGSMVRLPIQANRLGPLVNQCESLRGDVVPGPCTAIGQLRW